MTSVRTLGTLEKAAVYLIKAANLLAEIEDKNLGDWEGTVSGIKLVAKAHGGILKKAARGLAKLQGPENAIP